MPLWFLLVGPLEPNSVPILGLSAFPVQRRQPLASDELQNRTKFVSGAPTPRNHKGTSAILSQKETTVQCQLREEGW